MLHTKLHRLDVYHLTTSLCEISARSLKDFLGKGGKSAENTWIMINHANWYHYIVFWKHIFDLQIRIPRVHPIQISSRSDYTMWKHTKIAEKLIVLKRGLVPTMQPKLDFSQICGFREVLDNVEFQRYGQKIQKYP